MLLFSGNLGQTLGVRNEHIYYCKSFLFTESFLRVRNKLSNCKPYSFNWSSYTTVVTRILQSPCKMLSEYTNYDVTVLSTV